MRTVKWSDIEAECDGYKAGFVATFQKYEGQPTDKVDARGRTIKVTAQSFAERVGIDPGTFRKWLRTAAGEPLAAHETADAKHFRTVKTVARRSPSALVDAIQAAGVGAEDQVFHELKLRRAGFDTSPANRKAAHAAAHEIVKPFKQMAAAVKSETMIAALEAAADDLRAVIEEGLFTRKLDARITKALDEFQSVRAEGIFAIS